MVASTESRPQKWQRSQIRNGMERYREALENYYIKNTRLVEVSNGLRAFSLLSPSLGSNAARRRIRRIMNNISDAGTIVADDGATIWGSRTPHFATVAVTYDCQCDCQHCSAYSYKQGVARTHSALTLSELKDAIRQAVDLGTTCVILTGGEPLLYNGLLRLIESVDHAKSICTIFSNGEYLTEQMVSRLTQAGLFGVFVSLDSADPAQHDAHRRRKGIFEKALDGIKRCQDAGILTGLSSYITRENTCNGQLDAMMDLGKKLNVLEVFLFDVIATGKLRKEQNCMLGEHEVAQVKAFRKRYNEMADYPRIIHQTMFTSIAYPCAAEGCPAGVAQIHLRGNGDVAPCDFTPFPLGNIRQESLEAIWHRITESPVFSSGSRCCRLADPAYWDQLAAMCSGAAPELPVG